jgi:hypothetical protein
MKGATNENTISKNDRKEIMEKEGDTSIKGIKDWKKGSEG